MTRPSTLQVTSIMFDNVNYGIGVGCLKWGQNSEVLCRKRMPPKLKCKIYETVVYNGTLLHKRSHHSGFMKKHLIKR